MFVVGAEGFENLLAEMDSDVVFDEAAHELPEAVECDGIEAGDDQREGPGFVAFPVDECDESGQQTHVFIVDGFDLLGAELADFFAPEVFAAAFAGAGVAGSSLVTTLVVLNAIGLGPRAAAGIALVAGVDRPLDMCRTTLNTIGNLVGAAWIDRTEAPRGGADR